MNSPDFEQFAKMFGVNTADFHEGPSKQAEDFIKAKADELDYDCVGDLLNDEDVYEAECMDYVNSLHLSGEHKRAFD